MSTGLQQAIRGHVFERGAAGLRSAAHVFDPRFDDVLPDAVARPLDGTDVRDAIRFCTGKGISVRARSGGHSYAGYSTAAQRRRARPSEAEHDHGRHPAGHRHGRRRHAADRPLLAPGAVRRHGPGRLVSVGGDRRRHARRRLRARRPTSRADDRQPPSGADRDRRRHAAFGRRRLGPRPAVGAEGGGGGNFGVVTEFTFATHPMPASSTFFKVAWPWSSASAAIEAWQSWAPHTNDKITSTLHVETAPDIYVTGQYLGPSSDIPGLVGPLMAVPGRAWPVDVEHGVHADPDAARRLRRSHAAVVPHHRDRGGWADAA